MWLYLVEVGNVTKAGAAGIMGNMKHESGVIPNRVQMGYGWTDSAYTSAVDSGLYKNFVNDSIGYGLVQFTYWTLKKQVYDTAKSRGTSVGDLETQLMCVVSALKSSYRSLYSTLCSSNDVRKCCVAFLLQYERPADQSVAAQNKRTQAAQEYYTRCSGIVPSGSTTTAVPRPNINKQYAQTRYNLTYSPNRTVKHIVVHYTATSASAQNNCQYFGGGNRGASADFFINKDGSIYQFNADPDNYFSWHCGDGHGAYGITNAQSVGIEMVSSGEDFTSQQISSLTSLVAVLMAKYSVPAQNVVRHYDASRKLCPAPYIDESKWKNLWQQITSGNLSEAVGSTTTSTLSISYDRTKDPLVLEFGYASVVQKESDANMGTTLKAQKSKAKYPVSTINTAELLNDVFDIWGFNVQGGNTDTGETSGGQQVSGQAKTQSGKILTSGTWKVMPSSQPQTGIVANYTGYVRNWARGTTQRTVYDLWNSQGRPSKYTVAMVSGYYLIAPGRYFSNSAGDILEVKLENGYKFMAMVGDTKGPDTSNEYGHVLGSGGAVDVIEWESVCSTQSQLRQGLQEWGILNVKVSGMTNFGTFFQ